LTIPKRGNLAKLATLEMLLATLSPLTAPGEKHLLKALAVVADIQKGMRLRLSKLDYSPDLRFVPWTQKVYDSWVAFCGLSSGYGGIVIPRLSARGWRVDEDKCELCTEFFDTPTRGHAAYTCPIDKGVSFWIGSDAADHAIFSDEDRIDGPVRLEIHVAANQVRNDLIDVLHVNW